MKELHSSTVKAKRFSWKRLGSVPGCISLGAADIGVCELETGESVYISWGRNLDARDQQWFAENSHYKPVLLGSCYGHSELIIPDHLAIPLVELIVKGKEKV